MLNILKNTQYYKAIQDINNKKNITISGLSQPAKSIFAGELTKPIVFITTGFFNIDDTSEQLSSLGLNVRKLKFSTPLPIDSDYTDSKHNQIISSTLFDIVRNKLDAIVVDPLFLSVRLPSIDLFRKNIITLTKNDTLSMEQLKKQLTLAGYSFESILTKQGQFSYRGDCVDIFPINSDFPYRISFDFDTIEFIKSFNIETFSSIQEVPQIDICPATLYFYEKKDIDNIVSKIEKEKDSMQLGPNKFIRLNNLIEMITLKIHNKKMTSDFIIPYLTGYESGLLDYFTSGTIIYDDPKLITNSINENLENYIGRFENFYQDGELLPSHKKYLLSKDKSLSSTLTKIAFMNLANTNSIFEYNNLYQFKCDPVINYSGNLGIFLQDTELWLKQKKLIVIFTNNTLTCKSLYDELTKRKSVCNIINTLDQCEYGKINIYAKPLHQSADFASEGFLFISINDIYRNSTDKTIKNVYHNSSSNNTIKNQINQSQEKKEKVFYTPKVGEYVVHENYGIALCEGVQRLKLINTERDYVVLKFRDNDTFYLPTELMSKISSYIAPGNETPKLSKLGTDGFEREKNKVKASIKKLAIDLLKIYAEREASKGYRYEIDEILYNDFCNGFMHKETEDQLRAIAEIEKDMLSGKVMDRLVCGDVGFGKTEVAFRAMFIAVMNGKQVAFLCPTTVLSQQHYANCVSRMSPYMVNVEVLNRFITPKKRDEILERVANGQIDVLIGTTKILSSDIVFKDLGLLVLDEEQKFGVESKDKTKEKIKNINVLTTSATPIPRTLNMSLSGIRDISVIETPPENRKPVQTIVKEYSDTLIKDAIKRELSRDGQVLIIYNRVETISFVATHIQELAPDAIVDIAHGQMSERDLYKAISRLYNKETDILVSTTLIENGVDLPSANTLIVLDSQNLGLSTLYQLKGRVGRSNQLGYAYFTYPEHKIISETSSERLKTLEEFSSLGSGFKIAMRDLQIRGAGNILGKEQHGNIAKIGFYMYNKLLNDTLREIQGKNAEKKKECKININIDAYIPNNYVPDNEARFLLYSTISSICNLQEYTKQTERLKDQYGSIPPQVENLMKIALIQNLAQELNIVKLNTNTIKTILIFETKEKILADNISTGIKNSKVKVLYNIKTAPTLELFPDVSSLNECIWFLINFLSECVNLKS